MGVELNSSDNLSSPKDTQMAESFSGVEKKDKKEEAPKKKKRGLLDFIGRDDDEKAHEKKDKNDHTRAEDLFTSAADKQKQDEDHEEGPELPENPEELSNAEAIHIVKQLVEGRDAALKEELNEVEPDSAEEAEVLANALLMDRLAEKLEENPDWLLEDHELDHALHEVAQELEAVIPEEELAQLIGEAADTEEADDDVTLTTAAGAAAPGGSPAPTVVTPTAAGATPIGSVLGGGAGGTVTPISTTFASGGIPVGGGVGVGSAMPQPGVGSPDLGGERYGNKYQRGADMLVGGIVGYLIGRRRGRIKTEERLVPIQKSLERKVKDLHEKIGIREGKIRKMTSEKIAREGDDAKQVIADKLEARARAKAEARAKAAPDRVVPVPMAAAVERVPEPAPEETVSQQPPIQETVRPQTPVPEGINLAAALAAAEVARATANTEPIRHPGEVFERPAAFQAAPEIGPAARTLANEVITDMPVAKLLEVAEKIEVAGTNVKALYEQGRLEKQDLQSVVREYIRGSRGHERILAERLKPPRHAESPEFLHSSAGSSSRPQGGGSPFGAGTMAGGTGQPTYQQPTADTSQAAWGAADNRLAQETLQEKEQNNSMFPLIVAGVIFTIAVILVLTLL